MRHLKIFFFADRGILRTNLWGWSRKTAVNYADETIGALAVDSYNDRLYWTVPGSEYGVRYSNIDDYLNEVKLNVSSVDENGAILVDQNYVYYASSEEKNKLVRAEKSTGVKDLNFTISSSNSEFGSFARLVISN